MREVRRRPRHAPVYVSIDIDVLDPAFAPGTGTPEAGGLSSRELLAILRGLAGMHLVGADIVEVAPPFDHAEVTAMAASHVAYELLALTYTVDLQMSAAEQAMRIALGHARAAGDRRAERRLELASTSALNNAPST